tara:strand:- start:320 stop:778 length:459 start_codon:yes stop_codon:yes gene_type:complete
MASYFAKTVRNFGAALAICSFIGVWHQGNKLVDASQNNDLVVEVQNLTEAQTELASNLANKCVPNEFGPNEVSYECARSKREYDEISGLLTARKESDEFHQLEKDAASWQRNMQLGSYGLMMGSMMYLAGFFFYKKSQMMDELQNKDNNSSS